MDDYAIVLNAGSSSLKFCVYRRPEADAWRLEARGQIEGIGTSPRFSARDAQDHRIADEPLDADVADGRAALGALAAWLRSQYGGARVLGVGHRVVHGGARYSGPTVVTPAVLEDLRALISLAPLHQPHNLAAIEAVSDRLAGVPQVACFDTSFHRGQPAVAEVIPLPREICRSGVQRYGFHGLSYEYIASVLPEVAPEIARGRVIVAHLGSGASLCALKEGRSVDSSLGFTALDGLCMGTRPGALDPGVVLYLFQSLGLSAGDVEAILYKKSGLLGISGISNDMRVLLESSEPGARLAVDYFVYRAAREIGGLAAVLGGIGRPGVHRRHRGELGRDSPPHLGGVRLARDRSGPGRQLRQGPRISREGSRVSAWVIPTNEELMIARHTASVLARRSRALLAERAQGETSGQTCPPPT
jgi:acetate kinase